MGRAMLLLGNFNQLFMDLGRQSEVEPYGLFHAGIITVNYCLIIPAL